MTSVNQIGIFQERFVNYQNKPTSQKTYNQQSEKPPIVVDEPILKTGDKSVQDKADTLFGRADAYAKLSMQSQKMLQGYESVQLSEQRDAVRLMMGIDIFA